MKKYILVLAALTMFFYGAKSKPLFVVTSEPAAMILKELAGNRAEIMTLTPPGSSPHTYSPKPSQMIKAQRAEALFYIADKLDGWATKIPTDNKVELISLLPSDNLLRFKSGSIDPHFWLDPVTVASLTDELANKLSFYDKANAAFYKSKAKNFNQKLKNIIKKAERKLSGVKKGKVFLFHPSFRYFLNRFGFEYGGAIETSPGKEPTPSYLNELSKKVKNCDRKVIFSEPQLPEAPAKSLAEASGAKIFILDPVGGVKGRENYEELIMYNVKQFYKAFK